MGRFSTSSKPLFDESQDRRSSAVAPPPPPSIISPLGAMADFNELITASDSAPIKNTILSFVERVVTAIAAFQSHGGPNASFSPTATQPPMVSTNGSSAAAGGLPPITCREDVEEQYSTFLSRLEEHLRRMNGWKTYFDADSGMFLLRTALESFVMNNAGQQPLAPLLFSVGTAVAVMYTCVDEVIQCYNMLYMLYMLLLLLMPLSCPIIAGV